MAQDVSLLSVQFLDWVARAPRSHADVMDAWRSSCPRICVWEDALTDGLVRFAGPDRQTLVLTPRGRTALAQAAGEGQGRAALAAD